MLRNSTKSPPEVLVLCREKDVKAAALRFTDFFGRQHQMFVPISHLTEDSFEDGFGFDGSSIRNWQGVDRSDLLLVPLATGAWIDPFYELPTVVLTCSVLDPITREEYARDPRNVARRAENYLLSSGIADTACFGPEAEFFIFDEVRFDQSPRSGFYEIESVEGLWNRGNGQAARLGSEIRYKEGYAPVPPLDQHVDLRSRMMQTLIDCGIEVECHHHEVASAGQAEIDIRYDSLVAVADTLMSYKYIIRNEARRAGKTVTFMPKPLMGDNGSGMHVHLSLWKSGEPLFAGNGYAGLSDIGIHAIGGILKHARALLALTNPTTNSYKRLVPGFEAPVNLAYSQRNRSAALRIPMVNPSPKARRIEFRCPDPSCNPYLAMSAILMAAIDGVQNKIHPGEPMDKDLYDLPPELSENIAQTTRSLDESLQALEQDHEFLLRGDVFTEETLSHWVEYKREHEVAPMSVRPHPYEFCLYYDV